MLDSMVELTINADASDQPVVYLETFRVPDERVRQ